MSKRPRPEPGIWTRKDHGIRNLESLLQSSGRGSLTMLRTGVVLAVIIACVGLLPLISGQADFRTGRGGRIHLVGTEARALGVAVLAAAAFIHFHFYWGAHKKLSEHQGIGKIVAFAVFIAAVAFLVYRQFISF